MAPPQRERETDADEDLSINDARDGGELPSSFNQGTLHKDDFVTSTTLYALPSTAYGYGTGAPDATGQGRRRRELHKLYVSTPPAAVTPPPPRFSRATCSVAYIKSIRVMFWRYK